MRINVTFFLTFLSLFISSITSLTAQHYDPDFFPIGVWSVRGDFRTVEDHLYDVNKAAASHHEHFSDLHARGFNAAFMSLDPIVYTLDTILDIAFENDIKIIANMSNTHYLLSGGSGNPNITGDDIRQAMLDDSIFLLKNSPATLGYYIYDEPLPGWIDFDILAQAKDTMLSLTGGNHPILSTWNDVLSMDYIDGYLDLDVLMMDAYPLSDSTTEGSLIDYMPAYFSSYGDSDFPETIGPATPSFSEYIEQVRKEQCSENNRPFWAVFQSFGDAVTYDANNPDAAWAFWRQVKPKEIRLQAWIAVMQGAKGLWYFLYESEYPVLLGMLDLDGQPTARLEEATSVNAEINKISPILLRLKVDEVASNLSVDRGEARLHEDSQLTSGNKYVIVTNTDYDASNDIEVRVQKSALNYVVKGVFDELSEVSIPFTETSDEIIFVVSLDRATGSLFHLSEMPLAGDEVIADSKLILFPNPASDFIYLQSYGKKVDEIQIINNLGQLVFEDLAPGNKLDIHLLSKGVYFVNIIMDHQSFVRKIIVDKN